MTDRNKNYPAPSCHPVKNNLAMEFVCGFCCFTGLPGSGKSTLLNFICGEKMAIVTGKPQTTRHKIMAVKTSQKSQVIFLDTPGLHSAVKALNKKMMQTAKVAAKEADVIVFLCDATSENPEDDINWAKKLLRLDKPIIVAINKVDLVRKEKLLPIMQCWAQAGLDAAYPICALDGGGVDKLESAIIARLPHGPKLFHEDTLTQHPERFLAAELIREKLFRFTRMEIPYSSAVRIEEYKERSEKLTAVRAVIYVEKDSQKSVMIGQNGAMIKKIGSAARIEMEKRFGKKFYLELKVKTEKNWTRNENFLKRLGSEFTG